MIGKFNSYENIRFLNRISNASMCSCEKKVNFHGTVVACLNFILVSWHRNKTQTSLEKRKYLFLSEVATGSAF